MGLKGWVTFFFNAKTNKKIPHPRINNDRSLTCILHKNSRHMCTEEQRNNGTVGTEPGTAGTEKQMNRETAGAEEQRNGRHRGTDE